MLDAAGPWGTGPYKLVEGFSLPDKRSDRVVLEANAAYWDKSRFPRVKRIVFDNTVNHKEAVEAVKTGKGRIDLVTGLSPLETLPVAQSSSATVVKNRGTLSSVFGLFNMRRVGTPLSDLRVRQAANLAINRADVIRYAARGNGVVIPALVPAQAIGYDPALPPYPFDPARARQLLREAGHPDGLPITLIASEDLTVQATVVGKMLEQGGFKVTLQVLDGVAFNRKTELAHLDQPAEQQSWDIALSRWSDTDNFPVYGFYHFFAVDGPNVWVVDPPELRRLYDEVLRTVDPEKQRALTQQMERETRDRAYFLFLYNPVELFAVSRAVQFVPQVNGVLMLVETSVSDRHWSMRKAASAQ
jgi:peptide/nickel transport system substrate-binding protein